MINEKVLNDMFEKAEKAGLLKLAHQRTCIEPDVKGLKQICANNPRICLIKLVTAPFGFGCAEQFYECSDEALAREGRKALEEGILSENKES